MTAMPKTLQKNVTIFGGTGFIGQRVVRAFARKGYAVKIAARVPERAYNLRLCGAVGQVVPVLCDYNDVQSIADCVRGADIVVNCTGIIAQGRGSRFGYLHGDLPGHIAQACAEARVGHFVHVSALGAGASRSRYALSKFEGEDAVLRLFPHATILRPSVIFGEGDRFFNLFAELARYAPCLPLIGGGRTKFQPVFVGDVVEAIDRAATFDGVPFDPRGRIFELGGPDIVTFRDIYKMIFTHTHRRRALLPVPFWLMKILAAPLSLLPGKLITPDQVESLRSDNICSGTLPGFADLGMVPTPMAMVLPDMLARYRAGGAIAYKHDVEA